MSGRWMATIAIVVLFAAGVEAAPTPEEKCQAARFRAAGRYAVCQARVQAKAAQDPSFEFERPASRCRDKYRDAWPLLQAKYPGTSCAAARFVDNGDGTVSDNLTSLTWEKKTDDSGVHDKDNFHDWTTTGDSDFTNADGSAFTALLSALNTGSCLATHCDWRLPTREELQTIVLEPDPCSVDPCIDPIFGPINTGSNTWTSTTHQTFPTRAWFVDFSNGLMLSANKSFSHFVRAVRGGI